MQKNSLIRSSKSALALFVGMSALVQMFSTHAGEATTYPGGPGSLTGVWTNDAYKPSVRFGPREGVLLTTDGQLPPMQPWAAELLDKRVKDADAGNPYPTTMSNCLPAGVPQMMFGPRLPIQILETPGQVTMLVEPLNNFRIIYLNEPHSDDPDPSFMGESVGHWEGDTLVVDTIALTDKTTLDPIGMPHSDALHIIERFRRTGKNSLELVVTIDDPKTFTKSWTATTSFKSEPGLRVQQYFCENQRNPSEGGVMQMIVPPAQ